MYPIWLLDIDGVVNADPGQHHLWSSDQWIHTRVPGGGKDWRLIASKPVIDFITKVHDENWAEIVWLTTWQDEANNVADALGLPHFKSLINPRAQGTLYAGLTWWKLSEATRVLAQGRPTIWTDDDIGPEVTNLFLQNSTDQDCLVLAPKSPEGLAPVHLDKIASFLRMKVE